MQFVTRMLKSCKCNTILGSEMIGNLNIKTKIFDLEERALTVWLANTVRAIFVSDPSI